MSKLTRSFYLSCTVTVLFTITANTTTSWADNDSDESEIPFDEAHIFFELNHTDGDLGIHGKIDGEP